MQVHGPLAAESLHIGDVEWLNAVKTTLVPEKIYNDATQSIGKWWSTFADHDELLAWHFDETNHGVYGFGDKRYFDKLGNSGIPASHNTNNDVDRVFFISKLQQLRKPL